MGRGGWSAALCHQRAELRPLQNLRYQGPQPQHHLGAAGGRRREIFEYVMAVPCPVTIPPHRDSLGEASGSVASSPCGMTAKRPFCADSKGLAHRRPWRQPLVIVPTPFRRLTGVVLGAAALLLPASLAAQGAAQDTQISTYTPSAHELSRLTASGSYLAARHAGTQRDAGA